MRILHVAPSYYPAVRYGGPIWSVRGLAKGQAALGHEVHVFTTNADGPGRLDVPTDRPVMLDGVHVHYFPLGWPARLYRSPILARALSDHVAGFDVVQLHSVFLWPTLKAARAAKRAGVPYVVSPRGMLVKDLLRAKSGLLKRAWIALFERKTLEGARFIHVTADVEAQEMQAFGITLPAVVTVANGVEPPDEYDTDAVSDDVNMAITKGSYLLSLGRLSWKKNLIALIDAMAGVRGQRLIIAGNDDEGHAAELRNRIAEAGLGERISVLDRAVDNADKEELFARCDLFVLPSLSENFGNTALEAMARGKAAVVTHGCGVAEIVNEGKAGLVCNPDPASIGAAITVLLTDEAKRIACGASGRTLAEERYGWKHIAAAMVRAYANAGVAGG
jgi:glycosyltransferase involved in cell wall biosynthesis